MSHPTEPLFTTALHGITASPIVQAVGELDLDAATTLHTALRRALAVDPSAVVLVIDLAGVTFCDPCGLGALLRARIETERSGVTFHLARPTHAMARLLELTGADHVLTVERHEHTAPHPQAL
ncbi:STAS domain-containing protein [Kitasatospora herbaricolor]|uniref:Anti-sigma factor antagonist n=1 Tax=Kitasatospora herbaricolor TaxID=68217 RepID=A0ABZ1WJD8_9ACTN|nr:STAS domain-containing protein [Kitasatospora herbaricolor]